MSDSPEKKSDESKNSAKSREAKVESAPAAESAPVTRILRQGTPPRETVVVRSKVDAGLFRVKHGSVTLGFGADGEREVAHPGAELHLSAEDATALAACGTVERVA